jgi:SNF2 family DNA or RNA helicase
MPMNFEDIQAATVEKIEQCFKHGINPVCALPMGWGKTEIACKIIKNLQSKSVSNKSRILVIIKDNNFRDPWERILGDHGIRFIYLHGKNRFVDFLDEMTTIKLNQINQEELESAKYILPKDTILLTSYETAVLDVVYLKNIGKFDLIVFDECHKVINPKLLTQKSKCLSLLESRFKLALTGTPLQNYREDIGLLYIFLNEGKYLIDMDPDEDELDNDLLENASNKMYESHALLFNDINHHFTQRKEIILAVPYYNEMMQVAEEDNLEQQRNRYQRFLSNPLSLYRNTSYPVHDIPCAKVDAVKVILKNTPPDDKVVIFSLSKDVLNAYNRLFVKENYKAVIITGDDKGENLRRKLTQFNCISNFKILLTTLPKSSEGLNLQVANHVIILEFWWNPQKIFQAMSRIDRFTQKKSIFIYLLCYNNTDGEMLREEYNCYSTMCRKIGYSKEMNPLSRELPEIAHFTSQDNFPSQLENFIKVFTSINRVNSEIAVKSRIEQSEEAQAQKEGNTADNGFIEFIGFIEFLKSSPKALALLQGDNDEENKDYKDIAFD